MELDGALTAMLSGWIPVVVDVIILNSLKSVNFKYSAITLLEMC